MRLYGKDIKADTLSPLTLAFTGDAVFSLFIREMLVCDANRPVGELHKLSVQSVKASAQARAMREIMPMLTEKEMDVFKRGRNAHTSHTPPHTHPHTPHPHTSHLTHPTYTHTDTPHPHSPHTSTHLTSHTHTHPTHT